MSELKMNDYTDAILSDMNKEVFSFDDISNIVCPFEASTKITLKMLQRRPDIKKVLIEALDSLLIKWEDEETEEPEDFIDKQIISAVNVDPFIGSTVFECLMGITDLKSEEGDEMYLPSIFDTDNSEELGRILSNGGFREDHEPVPAKYFHLSDKHKALIYTNPNARTILAKMPSKLITESLVEKLCS